MGPACIAFSLILGRPGRLNFYRRERIRGQGEQSPGIRLDSGFGSLTNKFFFSLETLLTWIETRAGYSGASRTARLPGISAVNKLCSCKSTGKTGSALSADVP